MAAICACGHDLHDGTCVKGNGRDTPPILCGCTNQWGWETDHAEVVVCPSCAFSFDASHVDIASGGRSYSCPCCEESKLRQAMDAALITIKAVGDSTVKRLWREAGYDVPKRGSWGGPKKEKV